MVDLSPNALPVVRNLARWALAAAAMVVAWGVFAPAGHAPAIMPWDKAEHFTAFFGLMALSLVSFPKVPVWRLALIWSIAGAAVEVVQTLPFVHRDCDWKDWLADTMGILAVVGIVLAGELRRRLSLDRPALFG